MDQVCPLCNGMAAVCVYCDKCGIRMNEEAELRISGHTALIWTRKIQI